MKQILFIGQAPARPHSKHEVAGTYLNTWLSSLFTDDEINTYCHFHALIDAFPGATKNGHLTPTNEQVQAYRPALKRIIQDIQPELIVPVGKMAIGELFGNKNLALSDVIGRQFSIDPFSSLGHEIVCIPLPHPSGRSAWNYLHKEQVNEALQLLELSASLDE